MKTKKVTMNQVQRIFFAVKRHPGMTATWYANKIKHKSRYAPATVLRELHRMVNSRMIIRRNEPGLRPTVKAWRFYPLGA